MTYSALSHLECPRCAARHDADLVQGTCSCGSPLLARYDLGQVAVSPRDCPLLDPPTQTVLAFMNSRMPSSVSSRP